MARPPWARLSACLHGRLTGAGPSQRVCVHVGDNIARLARRQQCTAGSQATLHGWFTEAGPSQRVCVYVQ